MFIHSVYFWLHPNLSPDDQATFRAGVHSLTTIDTVERSHVGTPADTDRPVIDSSYSYALIAFFRDKSAHDAYQTHPTHDVFRSECSSFWSRVQIYDLDSPQPAQPAVST